MKLTEAACFTSWRPWIHYTPPPKMLSLQRSTHHPPSALGLDYTCGLADVTPPSSLLLEEVQWRHSTAPAYRQYTLRIEQTKNRNRSAVVSSRVAILDGVSSCRAGRLSQQAGNIPQLVLAVQPQGWSKSLESLTGLGEHRFCPSLATANVLNSTRLRKQPKALGCLLKTPLLWCFVAPCWTSRACFDLSSLCIWFSGWACFDRVPH